MKFRLAESTLQMDEAAADLEKGESQLLAPKPRRSVKESTLGLFLSDFSNFYSSDFAVGVFQNRAPE